MTSLAVTLIVILAQSPEPTLAVVDGGVGVSEGEATTTPTTLRLTPSVESKSAEQPRVVSTELPWYQRLSIGGFARVQVGYTFPLQDEQLVGGNGGFRVADFRLNLDFRPVDKLTVYSSIELAAPLVSPDDPLTGRRIVELRDAYVQYDVCSGVLVRAGQFRPSYDAEMLMADGSLPFISRSILSSGVNPPEGYGPRQPLAPDRQIGLQVGSKRFGGPTFGVKYALGLFNGAGPNQLFNDNNGVMPVGRVVVDLMDTLSLGLNASYNVVSQGTRPNRLYTSQVGYGLDLEAHTKVKEAYVLSAMVVLLGRSSTYSFGGLPAESALGVMGQVRSLHEPSGLEGALRFSYLEPSSQQVSDQVTELAAMVGWRPFHLPFRVLAQYTHRGEEAAVGYANDSVDVMLHAVW